MTQHLPECWAKFPSDPEAWCICEELRFCEDRVLNAARDAVTAIESNRDAVVWWERFGDNPEEPDEVTVLIELHRAIAAINSMREKK